MSRTYHVYILASQRNGTLYTGVTGNLPQRIAQHASGTGSEFTRKYGVTRLVYAEPHSDINEAIAREKQIKGWNRQCKLKLIEKGNPEWDEIDSTAV